MKEEFDMEIVCKGCEKECVGRFYETYPEEIEIMDDYYIPVERHASVTEYMREIQKCAKLKV